MARREKLDPFHLTLRQRARLIKLALRQRVGNAALAHVAKSLDADKGRRNG